MVSFRKFNKEHRHLYPTVSICFRGHKGQLFKPDNIAYLFNQIFWYTTNQEIRELKHTHYQKLLFYIVAGRKDVTRKHPNIAKIRKINFDKATAHFSRVCGRRRGLMFAKTSI